MTVWNNRHKHIKHETVIELDAVGNHFRDHHHPHEYTHEHFITCLLYTSPSPRDS